MHTEQTKLSQKKKYILITIATILLIAVGSVFLVCYLNNYYLELNMPDETITLEYGVDEMPEITSLCKGTLIQRQGKPVETRIEGDLNLKELGTYTIQITARYRNLTLTETRTVIVQDTLPPDIQLVSDPEHYTSPVGTYEEEGFTAIDNYDGDVTDKVTRDEHDGVVTYTVSDSSGNTSKVDRTIIYKDVIAPVITLTGGEQIQFEVGRDFSDPGFTATDECDGDLTGNVTVTGTVNGHTSGTYTLTYTVSDSSENQTEVKRTVTVGDFQSPSLTLSGASRIYVKVGESFSDPGYSANDRVDGDLTSKVVISGSVDTTRMGTNTLTYTVSDAAGNTATATRTVFVYQKQAVSAAENPGDKVVYLTFDDGPSKHTATLLDILDRYGVKATFFVTNQFPAYQGMIGESYRRGHTIALHTYSHVYSSVYASEDAYYNDLNRIRDVVVNQTGMTPTIVRFPGGTNNTVSKKYCKGIMSSLASSISYHGYLYCDWNVSSGDAGGAKTADAVANNVISGIQKKNVSVVLQHDITSFSVEATEKILFWGLENGYTFLPMSDTTPMVHYTPQN